MFQAIFKTLCKIAIGQKCITFPLFSYKAEVSTYTKLVTFYCMQLSHLPVKKIELGVHTTKNPFA